MYRRLITVLSIALLLASSSFGQLTQSGAGKKASPGGGGSSLNTSLISFFKLDEASGTRNDSQSTNNLTDNNTVTQAAGKISNAAQFASANSEYLNRASNGELQTGDINFTLAAWVYLDTNVSGTIMSKWGAASDAREYQLIYDGGGSRFQFTIHEAGVGTYTVVANNFGAPSTATWYLVIAWHDAAANTINISVNDGSANQTTGAIMDAAGAGDFAIGAYDEGGYSVFWNGRIDEAGFWKKILSGSERTELYNSGSGKTCCPFV